MSLNNPFQILEEKLENIESLLERISREKQPALRKTSLVSLNYFCNDLEIMKLPTAHIRLSKNGPGIPGATKIGRRWFIDMDQFEKVVRENGGLKSLELS